MDTLEYQNRILKAVSNLPLATDLRLDRLNKEYHVIDLSAPTVALMVKESLQERDVLGADMSVEAVLKAVHRIAMRMPHVSSVREFKRKEGSDNFRGLRGSRITGGTRDSSQSVAILLGGEEAGCLFIVQSFRVAQSFKTDKLLPEIAKIDPGNPVLNTSFDVGHIASEHSFTSTPAEARISALKSSLYARKYVNRAAADKVLAELSESLYSIHREVHVDYTKNNLQGVLQGLHKTLGSSFVTVRYQVSSENQKLGQLERQAVSNDRIRAAILSVPATALINTHFSPSILEDIQKGILSSIKGEKGSYSSSKGSISKVEHKEVKTLNTITPVAKFRIPGTGRFAPVNIANLQNMLNAQLHEQIKQNMGSGNSKNILNYRTGRFAESVKVERMSVSREGAITAFYSYMKSPYQTFEPGYAQGVPATRNPRILISKSIREIGSKLVANRMRAVVI